jgi:hypothetical protein
MRLKKNTMNTRLLFLDSQLFLHTQPLRHRDMVSFPVYRQATVSSSSHETASIIKTTDVEMSEMFVGLHVKCLLFLIDFNPN